LPLRVALLSVDGESSSGKSAAKAALSENNLATTSHRRLRTMLVLLTQDSKDIIKLKNELLGEWFTRNSVTA
jgi:hypothetical protein